MRTCSTSCAVYRRQPQAITLLYNNNYGRCATRCTHNDKGMANVVKRSFYTNVCNNNNKNKNIIGIIFFCRKIARNLMLLLGFAFCFFYFILLHTLYTNCIFFLLLQLHCIFDGCASAFKLEADTRQIEF